MSSDPPAVEVRDLHKSYKLGRVKLHVLRGVSLSVRPGEFLAIVGSSGSGKSTLLHLIGLLDKPDSGTVHLHGTDAKTLGAGGRNRVRSRDVGFVFQFFHLMPEMNVLDNVLLPARVRYSTLAYLASAGRLKRQAREICQRVGLGERLKHRPKELSGGERQRVALARALMNRPSILLADEPTGNLDSKTGGTILDLVESLNRTDGQTLLMVTHDRAIAARADRVLHLTDGQIA